MVATDKPLPQVAMRIVRDATGRAVQAACTPSCGRKIVEAEARDGAHLVVTNERSQARTCDWCYRPV